MNAFGLNVSLWDVVRLSPWGATVVDDWLEEAREEKDRQKQAREARGDGKIGVIVP